MWRGSEGFTAGAALGLARAQPAGGFVAVEFRHMAVHEDDVVVQGFGGGQDFEAIGGNVGAVAEAFKLEQGDALVYDIILGDEDPDLAGGNHGWRRGTLGAHRGAGPVGEQADERFLKLACWSVDQRHA